MHRRAGIKYYSSAQHRTNAEMCRYGSDRILNAGRSAEPGVKCTLTCMPAYPHALPSIFNLQSSLRRAFSSLEEGCVLVVEAERSGCFVGGWTKRNGYNLKRRKRKGRCAVSGGLLMYDSCLFFGLHTHGPIESNRTGHLSASY